MPVPSLFSLSLFIIIVINLLLARLGLLAWPSLSRHGAVRSARGKGELQSGGVGRQGMAWASDMNIICSSHCTVCTVRLRSPPRTHPRPVPAAKICPKDHEFSCRPVRKFRQLRVKRQLQDDGPALAAATSSTHTWHQLPAPASGYQQLAFHSTVRQVFMIMPPSTNTSLARRICKILHLY